MKQNELLTKADLQKFDLLITSVMRFYESIKFFPDAVREIKSQNPWIALNSSFKIQEEETLCDKVNMHNVIDSIVQDGEVIMETKTRARTKNTHLLNDAVSLILSKFICDIYSKFELSEEGKDYKRGVDRDVKNSDTEVEFFRHVRNACGHDNRFFFKSSKEWRPAEWRGKIISENMQGNRVLGSGDGFLKPGDCRMLLIDINNKFFKKIEIRYV